MTQRRPIEQVVLQLAIAIVTFSILAAILFPVFAKPKEGKRRHCISRMKQLATSFQIYTSDHDDRYPAKTWVDEIYPYSKNRSLTTCAYLEEEGKQWGYAMNWEVMGRQTSSLPEETIFLFETDIEAKDVVANTAAWSQIRHGRASVGCRVDLKCRPHFVEQAKKAAKP